MSLRVGSKHINRKDLKGQRHKKGIKMSDTIGYKSRPNVSKTVIVSLLRLFGTFLIAGSLFYDYSIITSQANDTGSIFTFSSMLIIPLIAILGLGLGGCCLGIAELIVCGTEADDEIRRYFYKSVQPSTQVSNTVVNEFEIP